MAGLTKEQRAARALVSDDGVEAIADTPAIGAVEQLTVASRAAVKAGRHAEHAVLERALFALYTARGLLVDVDLDGSVGAIKALL
jgi:lipid-binding SYLF domain-containing protein